MSHQQGRSPSTWQAVTDAADFDVWPIVEAHEVTA